MNVGIARHTRGADRTILSGLAGNWLRCLAGTRGLDALSSRIARVDGWSSDLPDALRRDFATELQNLLHYADQSAMAWSVESRMPFMDWRLVTFLARVPLCYRIHDGWTKWLARTRRAMNCPLK